MKKENPLKLKKYLFLICIVFCVITFSHLMYNYLYENSETKPKKGGTISEGIIGNIPNLNPLKPLSGNDKYILKYLYRSILKYDINQKKIVGDIAKCDISSLINIDCIINDDAIWSNGEKIKSDDIVSTYNLIKETNSNPSIKNTLKDVEIEANGNRIIFKNTKEDINFLNIFFQPIISQETINGLSKQNIEGSFPYNEGIYSGNYKLETIKADENLGLSKIILNRNEEFGKSNISKIIIYVFPDNNSLKINKQVINVFNDEFNLIGDSIPRFNSNKYILPQFVSVFINTSKIENLNLRTIILNEINRKNLVKLLGEKNYKEVYNPYFSSLDTDRKSTNENLEAILSSIGYQKKYNLIKNLQNDAKKKLEEKTNSGTTEIKENLNGKIDRSKGIDRYQKKSKIIKSPTYVDKYNFITKDDFKLIGKTENSIDSVYINDYKIKGFNSGDKEFFYRIKESYDNIKEGNNKYKIFFEKNGKKEFIEELNFLYYKDKEKLKVEEKSFINSLYDLEQKEIDNKLKIKETAKNNNDNIELNINPEKLKKIEALDDKLFYNKNLEPYSLNLAYLNSRKDFDETTNFIKKSLEEIGIIINLKPLGKKEFTEEVLNKNYDLILSGINLGYFKLNLYPYLHSSQVKSGFNYSYIKKTSLDLLLEESKENMYDNKKVLSLQDKIIEILKKEQIFKTLYSPKLNLLVDKNIKITKKIEEMPTKSLRSEIIEESYIKQEKIFSLKGKSITGFIAYLYKKIYE